MALLPPSAAAPKAPAGHGVPIPTEVAVREMMSDLFGRPVSSSWQPGGAAPDDGYVAVYQRTDGGGIVGISVADCGYVAHSGAALSMVPVTQAEEAIAGQAYPEALVENYYEVVNIMASLMNTENTPHVKLIKTGRIGSDELPPEAAEILAEPAETRHYTVSIEGYGDGSLTFLMK